MRSGGRGRAITAASVVRNGICAARAGIVISKSAPGGVLFVTLLPKTEAERRMLMAEVQENAERDRELAAGASRSGYGGSSASAPQPSAQSPSVQGSQPPMEDTLRRLVQEAWSQQPLAAATAAPPSEQLQRMVEGTLTSSLGADPQKAMNEAAADAVIASLRRAETRLTEFLPNPRRVTMVMLSSLAMATGPDPGRGIIHPNLASPGPQEVIAMDYDEEVLSAAEEVEMQAALLAMSVQPALQNWVPSGTRGTALNGHKPWHSSVLTPVPRIRLVSRLSSSDENAGHSSSGTWV